MKQKKVDNFKKIFSLLFLLFWCLLIFYFSNQKGDISKNSSNGVIDLLNQFLRIFNDSIDLNNIAYINDNFGHTEGDKVIATAASILINNQLSGSELLRTNGNEFLVFTVGHDEKSVVTYIRKLNKEFKELSHGFGAAIGYSMITDEIKTIDDAINEATLDMRSNKEEIKN